MMQTNSFTPPSRIRSTRPPTRSPISLPAKTIFELPKAVFGNLKGTVKTSSIAGGSADGGNTFGRDNTWAVNSTNTDDPDTTLNSMKDFIAAKADGFFETKTTNSGVLGSTTNQHSVAVVDATHFTTDGNDDGTNDSDPVTTSWAFIDVDGDGDFDAATDMVIKLNDVDLSGNDFIGA